MCIRDSDRILNQHRRATCARKSTLMRRSRARPAVTQRFVIHEWTPARSVLCSLSFEPFHWNRVGRDHSFAPTPFDNGLRRIADAETIASPGGFVITPAAWAAP